MATYTLFQTRFVYPKRFEFESSGTYAKRRDLDLREYLRAQMAIAKRMFYAACLKSEMEATRDQKLMILRMAMHDFESERNAENFLFEMTIGDKACVSTTYIEDRQMREFMKERRAAIEKRERERHGEEHALYNEAKLESMRTKRELIAKNQLREYARKPIEEVPLVCVELTDEFFACRDDDDDLYRRSMDKNGPKPSTVKGLVAPVSVVIVDPAYHGPFVYEAADYKEETSESFPIVESASLPLRYYPFFQAEDLTACGPLTLPAPEHVTPASAMKKRRMMKRSSSSSVEEETTTAVVMSPKRRRRSRDSGDNDAGCETKPIVIVVHANDDGKEGMSVHPIVIASIENYECKGTESDPILL